MNQVSLQRLWCGVTMGTQWSSANIDGSTPCTLCKMCKNAPSWNARVVMNALLAVLCAGDVPAQPADSFLALLQIDVLGEGTSVAGANIDACCAILDPTSLAPAATGSTMAAQAKHQEACAMERWCYNFLHTADDFARLKDRLRAGFELCPRSEVA